ncbi:MAG: 2-oxoglutarate dehydrogenase complex dihydrolipoyllysine-residue succinyltransferase [Thermaerobacter sp.]|nr:2-oxoglutarate dehydrogenase complex dihydrolipoyllysine-residue succinyltransferase [Thermaerobacter sp.]
MAVDIVVPPLGESLVEATVGSWLKKVGDPVKAGEPVLELETDKVNLEVAADDSGVLASIDQEAGAVVKPGDKLGSLEAGGAASAPPAPAPVAAESPSPAAGEASAVRAAPAVRRLAESEGVQLGDVEPSGARGRVLRDDVARHAPPAPAPAPAPRAPAAPVTRESAGPVEQVRLSRRRLTIARRLVETQHAAAMLTTFNEIDMTAARELRHRHQERFLERHGVRLGFMSFFTRAAVAALKQFPRLNAEIVGDDMLLKRFYHIGIAVAAEGGLVVPVVRDADRLSFYQIEAEIARLAKRARDNALGLEDLADGTFTITNGGVFGSLFSTPILNGPQVAILGMHTIQDRPIAVSGEVQIRPMMYVALSYDHRIVDGSEAVRFLATIKSLVENPEMLLLEG